MTCVCMYFVFFDRFMHTQFDIMQNFNQFMGPSEYIHIDLGSAASVSLLTVSCLSLLLMHPRN